jgi:hypothetical protein
LICDRCGKTIQQKKFNYHTMGHGINPFYIVCDICWKEWDKIYKTKVNIYGENAERDKAKHRRKSKCFRKAWDREFAKFIGDKEVVEFT